MFLLDMEISLENISDVIYRINRIMREGTDDENLITHLQGETRKMFPYLGCSVQSGSLEGESIYGFTLFLTREGREMEESWPMLVDGLNNIYGYLRAYW